MPLAGDEFIVAVAVVLPALLLDSLLLTVAGFVTDSGFFVLPTMDFLAPIVFESILLVVVVVVVVELAFVFAAAGLPVMLLVLTRDLRVFDWVVVVEVSFELDMDFVDADARVALVVVVVSFAVEVLASGAFTAGFELLLPVGLIRVFR